MAYSRDGFPHSLVALPESSFFTAPINAGVPVLDQDLNLMQSIMSTRSNLAEGTHYRCGWALRGDFSALGVNTFEMAQSTVLCHDRVRNILDTGVLGTNVITIPTTVGRPAGQTFDIVFVELWIEEVLDTDTIYKWGNVDHADPGAITNDIIDPAVGLPAAVRLQDRYRIRAVGDVASDETTAMTSDPVTLQGKKIAPEAPGNPNFNFTYFPNNDAYNVDTTVFTTITEYDDYAGVVFAFPIALIERTVGDDDVANGTVTDLRRISASKFLSFKPLGTSVPDCAFDINGQYYSPEVIDVVAANAVTIDFCDGNVHFVDLAAATADVTVTLLNPLPGGVYHISFKQHPTTPVQLIWPGDIDFVLGFAHLLTLIGGDIDVFQLLRTSNPGYRVFPMGARTLSAPACQQDLSVTSGSVVIDLGVCDSYRLFLTSAPASFNVSFINAQAGGVYAVKYVQGPVANKQPVYLDSVVWLNSQGTQENLSDDPNGVDIVTFYYDGAAFCAKLDGKFGTVSNFLGLTDVTDSNYTGKANYLVSVVPGETGLQLVDPGVAIPSGSMGALSDVTLSATTTDDVLRYNGTFWEDVNLSTFHDLDNHSDVVAPAPVNGQFLFYNGANWVPSSQSAVLNFVNFGGAGAGFETVVGTKSVADILQFKSLQAGTNVNFAGSSGTNIVINAVVPGGGETNTLGTMPGGGTSLAGTKTGVQLRTKNIFGGTGVDVTNNANSVTVSLDPSNPRAWHVLAGNTGAIGGETIVATLPTTGATSGKLVVLTASIIVNTSSSSSFTARLRVGPGFGALVGQMNVSTQDNESKCTCFVGGHTSTGANSYVLTIQQTTGAVNSTQVPRIIAVQSV